MNGYGQKYAITVKPIEPVSYGSTNINIYKRGYAGAVSILMITDDSYSITREFEDWNDHIIGQTLSFAIINNSLNYFDFIELMKAKEKEYFVEVVHGYQTVYTSLFNGFINVELTTQKYLHMQAINIVASSYLKKLEYAKPASIEVLQNKTFIDIILECLASTGSESNIRVNVSYVPEEDVLSMSAGQTFLNKTGVYTELFWENNIERKSSFEIIESICKTFLLYLYWWDGCWYLEQESDLWNETKYYVQYNQGTSYGVDSVGTVVEEFNPIRLVKSLLFSEMSQVLSCLPGVRKNSVKLDLKEYLNLVVNDFANIPSIQTTPLAGDHPPLREWRKYRPMTTSPIDWADGGKSFLTIKNSIKKLIPSYSGDFEDIRDKGLYTTFKIFAETGANLYISFKYGFKRFNPASTAVNLSDFIFDFNWGLCIEDGNGIANAHLHKNEQGKPGYVAGEWDWRVTYNTPVTTNTVVDGNDFDKPNKICQISETINLSRVYGLNLDINQTFVLWIGTEKILKKDSNYAFINDEVYFGDVEVTISEEVKEANLIEGEVNEDYLTEQSFDLDLADVKSLNYKNGILRGTDLLERTEKWFALNSPPTRPVLDWFHFYKAKQGHTTRQRLTGTVVYKEYTTVLPGPVVYRDRILRPFTLFTEDKQSNLKYVLTGWKFLPKHQKYVVQLDEYDNTTDVNIIV